MATLVLSDPSLPAAFRGADAASLTGQTEAIGAVRWTLMLGIVAAACGVASWRVGTAGLDIFAAAGAVSFVVSLVMTLKLSADRSEERWYRARAIAESVKTLAWRYAVGGDPFPVTTVAAAEVDRRFLERLREIVARGDGLQLAPVVGDQITTEMRTIRQMRLDERRASYQIGRVETQMTWYARKSRENARSAQWWGRAAAAANIAGITGALARFVGLMDLDLFGVAAAMAASATAWAQVKQHRVIAASYALTAQELSLVKNRLDLADDDDAWALEVSDAEEAVSREHTMWLARHGHPSV